MELLALASTSSANHATGDDESMSGGLCLQPAPSCARMLGSVSDCKLTVQVEGDSAGRGIASEQVELALPIVAARARTVTGVQV